MAARKRTSKAPRKAGRKSAAAPQSAADGVSMSAALAEAAWLEADAALAQALADFDEAAGAATAAGRREAMEFLGQSLAQAARRRGLARIGEVGARERFDAQLHELSAPTAKAPNVVRIAARGVARGGQVLVQPRVVAERAAASNRSAAKKKAAKKRAKKTPAKKKTARKKQRA
jgi:hypothetical protein